MIQPSPDLAPERARRHDGITPEREREFLETLAATGCITEAAAAIGISRTALYRMRKHDPAFSARWAEALHDAVAVLADDAFERAVKGRSEGVFYKGEQIGERVRHNDRMVMFLLRSHDPATYGNASGQADSTTKERPYSGEGRSPVSGRSQLDPDLRRSTHSVDSIDQPQPTRNCGTRVSPVLAQTLSTSHHEPEEDMDDETFRAELRKLRGSPELPRPLSKRAARRLAAKGRLPVGQLD